MKSSAQADDRRKVETFDLRGVTIDRGPFARDVEAVREFYLRVPVDDYLKGFRARAGLEAPGRDLGGWYNDGSHDGHNFGQFVSGLARLYAATGDARCKDKVDALVAGYAESVGPDGYPFSLDRVGHPHYQYNFLVGGLVDAHLYCQSPGALETLSRITDWAVEHLERSRAYGYDRAQTYSEWYIQAENLYRAYLATGDEKYLEFAHVWDYPDFWRRFAEGRGLFEGLEPAPGVDRAWRYHAYSHVHSLCGLGAGHLAHGEPWFLDALEKAYDRIRAEQCWATGGFGPDEEFLPVERLIERLETSHAHFETQCGSWAIFKITRYLLTQTGEARYGHWAEQVLYNGLGASLPNADDGTVFYNADYNIRGAVKRRTPTPWTCCAGSRPIAIADLHDLIWLHDAEALYVNLYLPSTLRWQRGGGVVVARQSTRFPEAPSVELRFDAVPEGAGDFALRLRAPEWLAVPMGLEVNGETVETGPTEKGWVELRRIWATGDIVRIALPMAFRLQPLDVAHPHPAALMYGPVVLAARSPHRNPSALFDGNRPGARLEPVAGDALTWRHRDDAEVLVRPFYAFKEAEPYYLYLDPAFATEGYVGADASDFEAPDD